MALYRVTWSASLGGDMEVEASSADEARSVVSSLNLSTLQDFSGLGEETVHVFEDVEEVEKK
jgi:hypothetical protein